MSGELEYLLERTRIIEVISRLFSGTDNRDREAVQACFAASVSFDMSSPGAGDPRDMTPDVILVMRDAGLKPLQAIHHQTGNFLVDVDEHEADAFCYGIACHCLPDRTGNNIRTCVGSYAFPLVKDGGCWRICTFRFNLKFIDGHRDLEGSA